MLFSDAISVRSAARIVTVSETSRRDICRYWRIADAKVVNLSEGIDDRFFERPAQETVARAKAKFGIPDKYVIYVGGFDPRKDVETLVRAFALVRENGRHCVIVGSFRSGVERLHQAITANNASAFVTLIDEIPDSESKSLIAGAECFVYPSQYEGFGLQAAESMALGTPLITSDGGSLPEITQGHALTFRVGNFEELAERLITVFGDGPDAARRASAAKVYAERFRWSNVVKSYVSLYRTIASGKRGLVN